MAECPTCGKTSPRDPDTGYDGGDFCSWQCEIEARPLRYLVEVERAGRRWRPATLGARLLVFEDRRRAEFLCSVLTLRRFSLPCRVVETLEYDSELMRRAVADGPVHSWMQVMREGR